ncbi:MAG: RsmD family RNA methyltransferase [Bacteroidota bacterium]|nr:RsmD family RNA methyltransferase [Bacteroidota bacterium]
MRIISGTHKGRTIKVAPGLPVRPTTDFAKEALFNILNNRVDYEGLQVLDLFCGTGNISFEFASRGAKVTGVDMHFKCVSFVQSEAQKLKLDSISVIKADVFKFVSQKGKGYDLVFADPPYDTDQYPNLHKSIIENGFLNEGGLLIIEHSKKTNFEGAELFTETREYGNVNFSFFHM